MSEDILSTHKRRRVITAPREDKDINPKVLHRIKTYIGSTSLGPVQNRKSLYESKNSKILDQPFAVKKKTDTKMELVITSLVVMGYTIQSIADSSEELFGIKLSRTNVMAAYKRVLFAPYKINQFINKIFIEESDVSK